MLDQFLISSLSLVARTDRQTRKHMDRTKTIPASLNVAGAHVIIMSMSMSYTLLNKKFSEECVGLYEEMGLQPISELFTTDGG